MAGRASGGDRSRGATRPLGARPRRVLPEPKRDADRVRERTEERDRAVHAAAHGDGDPSRLRRCDEDLVEGGRERFDGERIARHTRCLEQGQSGKRPVETLAVTRDDAIAVDRQANGGPTAVPGRIAENLANHGLRLAATRCREVLHPADEATAIANLALPGGCRAGSRQRLSPTPAPFA